jgi:hypothetical protein
MAGRPTSAHPLDTGAWEQADLPHLRSLYKGIRERALESAAFDPKAFDAEVRKRLPVNPSPKDWVQVGMTITATCFKCGGSGIFRWGKQAEYSGKCFACGGSGQQDDADRRRNWGYWERERRRAEVDPAYVDTYQGTAERCGVVHDPLTDTEDC